MKSVFNVVQGLYAAILLDVTAMYPSISRGTERDAKHLRSASASSGLKFFTLTLPAVGKAFDRSLADGQIVATRPPFMGAKSRLDARPRLFFELWALVFCADGTLKTDADTDAIACLRQLYYAVQKIGVDCDVSKHHKAIRDFVVCEQQLPPPLDSTWDHVDPVWRPILGHPLWGAEGMAGGQGVLPFDTDTMSSDAIEHNWGGFRQLCGIFSSQLGELNPLGPEFCPSGDREHCSEKVGPKHGPGAVADRGTKYTKYDMPYWTDRLEAVFPMDVFAVPNWNYLDYITMREFPSRLMSVPKTQKGPRLIAAEPVCHQWIQGGIERWLVRASRKTALCASFDIHDQTASQQLTLDGSKDGSIATVDLSSASDRLSARLVHYVFQANASVLDALHACRTACCEVPGFGLIRIKKFATMGSACTFPVQSIVFSLIACYSVCLKRGMGFTSHSLEAAASLVRVYGDDIIVPVDVYPVLVSTLTECGLQVSADKSYATGLFRESCGMDAFAGADVTPARLRDLYSSEPSSVQSIVECSNNFFMKGFWHTADFITTLIPPKERRLIGVRSVRETGAYDGALAWASYCGSSDSHLKSRWNDGLQRREVRVLAVRSTNRKRPHVGHGSLMQFFVEEPPQDVYYSSGQAIKDCAVRRAIWVGGNTARMTALG